MYKKGFTLQGLPNLISSAQDKAGWALCIGAGTSAPVFPDWYALAERLAQELVPEKQFNLEAVKKIGFSPDALIQMVKNSVEISDVEFSLRMSEVLYKDFKANIREDDWCDISNVLGSNSISNCPMKQWGKFSKYRDSILNENCKFKLNTTVE